MTALLVARLALALIFAVAAVGKLADRAAFRKSLRAFGLPRRLTRPAVWALPLFELVIAALLIPTRTAPAAAWAAVGLLVVFSVVIARALVRGERPDCGCFGTAKASPISGGVLARNGVLAAVAGAIAVAGPGEAVGAAASSGEAVFGAAVVAAILALAWFTWQLFNQNGRLVERVRALEATIEAGGQRPEPPARDQEDLLRPVLSVERVEPDALAGSRAAGS